MTAEASGEFLEDLGAETAKLEVRAHWADSTATWVSGRTEAWGAGPGGEPASDTSLRDRGEGMGRGQNWMRKRLTMVQSRGEAAVSG